MNLLRLITFRKGVAALDPDAQAFLTAIGNTDPTIETAINDLVIDLKNYGLWTKMTAIYPMVGGTSSAHSYNLKDTTQYQITWNGTITHNSDGITGDGTSGYGQTGLIPSASLSLNSVHYSSYARTVSNDDDFEFGTTTNFSDAFYAARRFPAASNSVLSRTNQSSTDILSSISPYIGLFHCNRSGSSASEIYYNGTLSSTSSTSSTSLCTLEIYLLNFNENGNPNINYYCNYNFAFFSFGSSLDSTEAGNLYTAVQDFQTTLGRQV